MIKAIGLDLDDTLYDRNKVYEKVYGVMERNVLTTDILFRDFNQVFQQKSQIEFQKFDQGIKSDLESKIDRTLSAYEELGFTLTREQALIFHTLYLYYRDQIEVRPGMKRLIDFFYAAGMELFILTNGTEKTQLGKLYNLGLDKKISPNNFFISEQLGAAKPNRKVFEAVEFALGLKGTEILYIGDHFENDIISSQQNNWNTLYYNVNDEKVSKEKAIQFYSDIELYKYAKNKFS